MIAGLRTVVRSLGARNDRLEGLMYLTLVHLLSETL